MQADDLIGSWRLEGVELVGDNAAKGPPAFGGNPQGILHYLPDGRMAVLIQNAERAPIEGGRRGGSDAEWRRAARTFTAYAGSWTVEPGRVVHHVEFNSFPNDVGVDYIRIARIEGDLLHLETPSDLPADQRPMRLVWKRLAA